MFVRQKTHRFQWTNDFDHDELMTPLHEFSWQLYVFSSTYWSKDSCNDLNLVYFNLMLVVGQLIVFDKLLHRLNEHIMCSSTDGSSLSNLLIINAILHSVSIKFRFMIFVSSRKILLNILSRSIYVFFMFCEKLTKIERIILTCIDVLFVFK